MDILTRKFLDTYTQTKYVTINEAMVSYKGRLDSNNA